MTEQEFLAAINVGSVRARVVQNIPAAFRADIDDAVQQTLVITWAARDRIEFPLAFALRVAERTAKRWRERDRRILDYCAEYVGDASPAYNQAIPSPQFQIKQLADLLPEEKHKQFEEWKSRDFSLTTHTHAEECAVSRIRSALRAVAAAA